MSDRTDITPTGESRALNVAQWHDMAQNGIILPVRTLVNGGSMWPLIRRNRDVVTVMPLQRTPQVGEIVLFPSPTRHGVYVIHRVWHIDGQRIQTLGDNCAYPEQWQDSQSIWGIVTDIERGTRHLNPTAPLWETYGKLWLCLTPLRPALGKIRRAVRTLLRPLQHKDL